MSGKRHGEPGRKFVVPYCSGLEDSCRVDAMAWRVETVGRGERSRTRPYLRYVLVKRRKQSVFLESCKALARGWIFSRTKTILWRIRMFGVGLRGNRVEWDKVDGGSGF